jgi:hypothetical protein
MQEERLPKLIMEWIPGERRKKRTSKRNVDGSCTSSHKNKTFRSRSVVKQKGMVFGFRKMATAVTRPGRWIDRKSPLKKLEICECDGHTVHKLTQRHLTAD